MIWIEHFPKYYQIREISIKSFDDEMYETTLIEGRRRNSRIFEFFSSKS